MKTLACLLGALATCTGVGHSTPLLDQSQTYWQSIVRVGGDISVAQTFTPSVTGFLTQLDLFAGRQNFGETNAFLISIANTQGGLPNSVLATVSQTAFIPDVRSWYSYDFSSAHLTLNAGVQYAIVLGCPGSFNGIGVGGSLDETYQPGVSLQRNGTDPWSTYGRAADLMFQTYMTQVPEPSRFALATATMLAFLFFRHAKKAA